MNEWKKKKIVNQFHEIFFWFFACVKFIMIIHKHTHNYNSHNYIEYQLSKRENNNIIRFS